VKGCRQLSF